MLESPCSHSSPSEYSKAPPPLASPTNVPSGPLFPLNMIERYYAPNTPEYRAHSRIQEDYLWEDDQGAMNERLIALNSSYQALARYISGTDIYLMPRSSTDLLEKLKRYAADAIHNTIAQSRRPMEEGGYGRILALAHQSLRQVMATGTNTIDLLNLHVKQNDARPHTRGMRGSPGRIVATK